jgi:hypothetical protein
MNRVLLLISAIWVAMLLTPTVAAADAEIVLIEKEIDDDHIIIRRENGERLLLEKWSLRFSSLSFEGKTFVASVSPMWVTIYLEDRDEIKWSIEERLDAPRHLASSSTCGISTGVRSPDRMSWASWIASRRSVLARSPAFSGRVKAPRPSREASSW